MTVFSRAIRIVLALALVLWAAALISAAIAAMNVFGFAGHEALAMDRYTAFPTERHPMLLAGGIMEGVFFVVDVLQFVLAPIALLCLLLEHVSQRVPLRTPTALVRAGAIVAATAIFAWHGLVAAPGMNRELRAYWTAAEAGDVVEADRHLAEFNSGHGPAETRQAVTILLVLVAAGSNAVVGVPERRPRT